MKPPSRFRSLRWQLPLSYAGIALLAVLALGLALIGTLRSFYGQQERSYLTDNALVIADELAPLLETNQQQALQPKISGYAFLIQTRIQVLQEPDYQIIADSGEVESINPSIAVGTEDTVNIFDSVGTVTEEVVIIVAEERQPGGSEISSQRTVTRTSRLPAQGSLYGFSLGPQAVGTGTYSDLVVEVPISDAGGAVLGRIRLSQGPAYGQAILNSVVWGWFTAGTAAVFLAALGGWLISLRLTKPLLALTSVTGRMAEGDLKARADIRRSDELGLLGSSFNRMATQVENTVRSLRRFTADAAHELHTPLTALQTDLQLLQDGNNAEQGQRIIRARGQAQRLQDLADNLLELSMLEAEPAVDLAQEINLSTLMQEIGEIFASQAEQLDLTFVMALPEQPIFVKGNEGQLRRALINILENSLKFTPSPGRITFSLIVDGASPTVVVQDTGIGIDEQDKSLLFSRFHRGRNTADYPGSGLGLAIVHEIMLRHEGQVSVDSGQWGTQIKLIFPQEAPAKS